MRILWVILLCVPLLAFAKNGFDLTDATIPPELIRAGGPPKDGIPAINNPVFETAESAGWLKGDDRVIGLSIDGIARAYPIAILNWHEIVNDRFGEQAVVVSFCPLCGTGMVFDSEVKGETQRFGVSGLLFESDVLLYDQSTNSLWSQIWMQAVSGPLKGTELELLPAEHTSWHDWRTRYPETTVLSRETGFARDYSRNPYLGYELTQRTYFPVQNTSDAFHGKSWVLGVILNGEAKAYPFERLAQREGRFTDQLGGESIELEFDAQNQTARAWRKGELLPTIQAYWFAWYAFYPESAVLPTTE